MSPEQERGGTQTKTVNQLSLWQESFRSPWRPGRGLLIGHTSSGAEELAKRLPTSRVVSAFHTIPNEVLDGVFARRNEQPRPNVVYSGDDSESKELAARLI